VLGGVLACQQCTAAINVMNQMQMREVAQARANEIAHDEEDFLRPTNTTLPHEAERVQEFNQ
jgi:hypothetical protein